MTHRFGKLGILFLILAFVLVPATAFAQGQKGGAGATGADSKGAVSVPVAAGGTAGPGATAGLSTSAILGIAAAVALVGGAIALASGGGTTSGHGATAGH